MAASPSSRQACEGRQKLHNADPRQAGCSARRPACRSACRESHSKSTARCSTRRSFRDTRERSSDRGWWTSVRPVWALGQPGIVPLRDCDYVFAPAAPSALSPLSTVALRGRPLWKRCGSPPCLTQPLSHERARSQDAGEERCYENIGVNGWKIQTHARRRDLDRYQIVVRSIFQTLNDPRGNCKRRAVRQFNSDPAVLRNKAYGNGDPIFGDMLAHSLFGFTHLAFGDINKSSLEVFSIQCGASRLRFASGERKCLRQPAKNHDSFAGLAVPPDSPGRRWRVAGRQGPARAPGDGRSDKSRRGQRRCAKSLACSRSIHSLCANQPKRLGFL